MFGRLARMVDMIIVFVLGSLKGRWRFVRLWVVDMNVYHLFGDLSSSLNNDPSHYIHSPDKQTDNVNPPKYRDQLTLVTFLLSTDAPLLASSTVEFQALCFLICSCLPIDFLFLTMIMELWRLPSALAIISH